jgi:hypothetical protein
MIRLELCLLVLCAVLARAEIKNAIRGSHCLKNQAVNKVTVYEDGAIEAECGPIPCGTTGEKVMHSKERNLISFFSVH